MHLDLARLPDDIALLQQLVRDLAGYLDRRTAELDESKARLAVRDAEIEKLQLFLAVLRRQRARRKRATRISWRCNWRRSRSRSRRSRRSAIRLRRSQPPSAGRNPAGGRCRSICRARRAGTNPRAAPARPAVADCTSLGKTSARSSTTNLRSSR